MKALKVLLVEDDPSVRKICGKYFIAEGHELITAEDGLEGLNLARSQNPDVIVFDVMLPKMDGYKACRILKSDPRSKHIPIIIHTARMEHEDKTMAENAGADAFIIKTEISKLLETIEQLASEQGTANE